MATISYGDVSSSVGFFHGVAKHVSDMSIDEIRDEIESCVEWNEICEKSGQGVNSKEYMRERHCRAEITKRIIDGEITVDEGFDAAGV